MATKNTEVINGAGGEIVLYQPDESVKLEVKIDSVHETVWLTQQQIADLFGTKRPAITKHLNNIFASGELDKESTSSILEHVGNDGKQRYSTAYYNLDAIISVGYRVNSVSATAFRRWATSVLREYLLKGVAIHQRFSQLEESVDRRLLSQHDEIQQIRERQDEQQKQLDAYVSALTLDILDVRRAGVEAVVYTGGVGPGMQRLMQEHDRLFPEAGAHIDIRKWRNESHDRWLIIDERLYHCGHSLNANGGHKISAVTLMGTSPEVILAEME